MIDLDDTYRRLAGPSTEAQLAARYRSARGRPGRLVGGPEPSGPVSVMAEAILPSATVSTAIYMLHALPNHVDSKLPEQLLAVARRNIVDALHCCHGALELDGADHGYPVDEWLSTVYDIAGTLLEYARLDTEPPTIVELAHEAISWLSRAIVEFDEGSEEAAVSLAQTLARLLAVWIFIEAALGRGQSG